jgi:hypothetical protein
LSEQLQLRSGTATQVAAFTGALAECVVDTTNNRIVVNDGSTVGGWAAAKLVETITNTRTGVSDAAYMALTTDRLIAYTSLTAARVVTLPTAASYPTGTQLTVIDETGACSSLLTITISPAGSDDIDGAAVSIALNTAYASVRLESSGTGWFIVNKSYPTASTILGQSAHGAYLGLAINDQAVTLSGSSTNGPTQIPANSIVLAVAARVVTAITGTSLTGFEVGVSGNLSQFGSGIGLGAGTTNYGIIGPTGFYSATTLTITAQGSGSPSFSGGTVHLSIIYFSFSPPTD